MLNGPEIPLMVLIVSIAAVFILRGPIGKALGQWIASWGSPEHKALEAKWAEVAAGRALYNFQEAAEWAAGIEDLSGDSVFYKDESGQIFHTYSTYGRGGEQFLGIYGYLDVMPKGRNENGPYHSLTDWARLRNMYGKGGMVEATGRYHRPNCGCTAHH